MEPMPLASRMPPRPPRPPAPPTADDRFGGGPRKRQPRGQSTQIEPSTSLRQFLREVRGELRKMAWPGRAATAQRSSVVATFIAAAALTLGVAGVLAAAVLLR